MLTLVAILLVIMLLSRVMEESLKVPSTLTIIALAFSFSYLFSDLFVLTHEEFDDILYLMLPMILLPDVLNISVKELKEHAKEIFYLAVVSVVVSISIATLVTPYIMPEIEWSLGMLIALFSMLMATDAITVASIMSKFKLPQRLKIYAESESLFNDVTALIIFYFIALPLLTNNEVTVLSVNVTLVKVIFLSLFIGITTALVGYFFIKILKETLEQFIVIYLVVISSFLFAEHFHISGILAILTSVITFKILVEKDNDSKLNQTIDPTTNINSLFQLMKRVPAITKKGFREYQKEATFIGIFANAIVFIIIANVIHVEDLILYYKEILIIFLITTIIRYSSIFSMVKIFKLPTRWTHALTLAGSKGALVIIMSHSLPQSFEYREMFIAIVIGIVLLSTFVYTLFLILHIYIRQQSYKTDILVFDAKEHSDDEYVKSLVNVINKDPMTDAYNKPFIEDILIHELSRAQRYKSELSIISFKLLKTELAEDSLHKIGEIVVDKTRTNDYFGKTANAEFIILASNTSISGAVILAEKLLSAFTTMEDLEINFGLTQVSDTDTLESIYEKLEDALNRSTHGKGEKIEIEI